MRYVMAWAAALGALTLSVTPASAGVYTDEMAKCLVSSATPADNEVLVKWVFAALSVHPAVKPMTTVTAAQRDEYSRAAIKVIERLVLNDCRKESTVAVKVDGYGALQNSFNVLGQVAFRGLMANPDTTAAMASLAGYMDRPRWQALDKEAGYPTLPASK